MVIARRRVDRRKREKTRNKLPSHECICDAEIEADQSSPEEKARTPKTESGRMKPKPEPKSRSLLLSNDLCLSERYKFDKRGKIVERELFP